uniref:Uncharacterized protein n=1 Tax=Solanum lycopersicum TaxID=4081 RepID=A0A3Q7H4I0_SOLLC
MQMLLDYMGYNASSAEDTEPAAYVAKVFLGFPFKACILLLTFQHRACVRLYVSCIANRQSLPTVSHPIDQETDLDDSIGRLRRIKSEPLWLHTINQRRHTIESSKSVSRSVRCEIDIENLDGKNGKEIAKTKTKKHHMNLLYL